MHELGYFTGRKPGVFGFCLFVTQWSLFFVGFFIVVGPMLANIVVSIEVPIDIYNCFWGSING